MEEFIYSIKEIFEEECVLGQTDVSEYYIATYQRGYKWGAENKYDQVPRMLLDIYQAYSRHIPEYYLQYITVMKRDINGKRVLEVIDGQQRLTTLSLFYSTLHEIFPRRDNITKNKLNYARYEHDNIFEEIISFTSAIHYDVEEIKSIDTQDKYYMSMACRCIYYFLTNLEETDLDRFLVYLADHVKLIVNLESEFVKPEDVFCNLNDNKVALTNAELIKGLLLTLGIKKDRNMTGGRVHYQEIMDQRAIMGRMWDEINAWIHREEVCWYFFGTDDKPLENLLGLITLPEVKECNNALTAFLSCLQEEDIKHQGKSFQPQYLLFEKFNEAITSNESALDVMNQLKHVYRTLRGFYDDVNTDIYNLLGFFLFAKHQKKINRPQVLKSFIEKSRNERLSFLKSEVRALIPDMTVKDIIQKELKYDGNKYKLTNLLLSFSVFPADKDQGYRFNFYQYDHEKWSFEHVFPQHPKSEIRIENETAIRLVCDAVDDEYAKRPQTKECEEEKSSLLKKLKNKEKIRIEEGLEFLYSTDFDINRCGNMALLPGNTNTALSNNPFIAKRPILMEKIIDGYFVPQHTVNVFFKNLISPDVPFNAELTKWDEQDVTAHEAWMIERNQSILNELK